MEKNKPSLSPEEAARIAWRRQLEVVARRANGARSYGELLQNAGIQAVILAERRTQYDKLRSQTNNQRSNQPNP